MKIKFAIVLAPLMVVIALTFAWAQYNTSNYMAQGGASWVVGSALTIASGGTQTVASGGNIAGASGSDVALAGDLKIGASGTTFTQLLLGTASLINSATKSVALTGADTNDIMLITSADPDPAAAVALYVVRAANRFQIKSTAATTATVQYMFIAKP